MPSSPPFLKGSFRQRARTSERATQRLSDQRRKEAAARTHLALDKFDEQLAYDEGAELREYEALDEVAGTNPWGFGGGGGGLGSSATAFGGSAEGRSRSEARDYRDLIPGFAGSSNSFAPGGFNSSVSAGGELARVPPMSSSSAGDFRLSSPQQVNNGKKPPSPLTFYDYGCVSLKPRSKFAQHQRQNGESARPDHRRTACGFYFPGADFTRGPYGFSVVDPVLLPPRSWDQSEPAPDRWRGDAGDLRPLAAQELGMRRNRAMSSPVISPSVRSTTAHAARAKLAFQHLDKRREESVIEQARFENGVFEGRWRDPLLDNKGMLPEASAPQEHSWVAMPLETMDASQVLALRILHGIDHAVRRSFGRFSDVFAAENAGAKGVLELSEFMRGLVRLGVVDEDELAIGTLQQVVAAIDTTFDGRVNVPVLQRAVIAVRNLGETPPPLGAGVATMWQWGLQRSQPPAKPKGDYGEAAPVDAVRLNFKAGLYNFGRSFEKFRAQQKELLAHHQAL